MEECYRYISAKLNNKFDCTIPHEIMTMDKLLKTIDNFMLTVTYTRRSLSSQALARKGCVEELNDNQYHPSHSVEHVI